MRDRQSSEPGLSRLDSPGGFHRGCRKISYTQKCATKRPSYGKLLLLLASDRLYINAVTTVICAYTRNKQFLLCVSTFFIRHSNFLCRDDRAVVSVKILMKIYSRFSSSDYIFPQACSFFSVPFSCCHSQRRKYFESRIVPIEFPSNFRQNLKIGFCVLKLPYFYN